MTATPEFRTYQQRIFTAVGKIQALDGPAVAKVFAQWHGLVLSDLDPNERKEIEHRLAMAGAIVQAHGIESDDDYRRLPTRDAARILAHLVAAVDW
ncbi:MAG: hypothetical protein EA401_00235 [Planctomycetota bacterium]|nr:MAG: hypothetical protein EA401_00235 [Planctomycetota bacterium]